jgi:hypothetical protein
MATTTMKKSDTAIGYGALMHMASMASKARPEGVRKVPHMNRYQT